MAKIKNYTLKQFLKLPTEEIQNYLPLLENIKPLPNFKSKFKLKTHGVEKSLTELTWGKVVQVRNLLNDGNLESMVEAIKMVYNYKNVFQMNIFRFYGCVNFLVSEIKKISEVEAERYKMENTKYDMYFEDAGANELSKFSEISVLDTLSNGNILRFEQIEKLPYLTIHYFLWYRAVKENINIRFQKIMEKTTNN